MRGSHGNIALCLLIASLGEPVFSQTTEFHGQASGWLTSTPAVAPVSQAGLRYIPDLLVGRKLNDDFDVNMEAAFDALASGGFGKDQSPSYNGSAKLYRAWIRLSTEKFEARIGLQKLSFGSAALFRPLMWFDRIDPRDPLQLTDGVYGMLVRYYFLNNANLWVWGLYGNTGTKGWELSPTERRSVEYGGRVQSPLWTGEVGLTYHHRRADLGILPPPAQFPGPSVVPEDRIALDGKWDIGIGVWFESSLVREETALPGLKYRRLWTIGGDYTVGIGNGVYVATEYFRSDNPAQPFASSDGVGFSGLSMSYPLGVVDQLSAILYRDWSGREWYRIITWQRKYDNWIFYLLGFWNPETIRLYGSGTEGNAFGGTGLQLMVVFNH